MRSDADARIWEATRRQAVFERGDLVHPCSGRDCHGSGWITDKVEESLAAEPSRDSWAGLINRELDLMSVKSDRRACWLLRAYGRFLIDQDSSRFAHDVGSRYLVGTLEGMAQRSPREARRAAVLALGLLADYRSSIVVGARMRDPDRGVRLLAERASLALWLRDGTREQQARLCGLQRANAASQFDRVICQASELLRDAPRFAEVWHQRAISYFWLGDTSAAMRDLQHVLSLNPYHFFAAMRLAQSHVQLNEPHEAQAWLERALLMNPGLEGVRQQFQSWRGAGHSPRE